MTDGISEALKKKDKEQADRKQSRRRVRGGGPATTASGVRPALVKTEPHDLILAELRLETDNFTDL